MPTRSLNVAITGDARSLNKVLADTESRTKRSMGAIGKGFAVAGAAAAGGLAVGLKKSAEAAIEAEKSQARLVTQLRAAGISYEAHAKQIDAVIQKQSTLSGLDDEDLADSFTNIVRVTGDVNEALRLNAIAADFARAKHMDVAKAGELVGKVAGGNTGILSRYGISIEKGASSTEALGLLQRKFAGQAEAYGKTTAGAMDRAGVASENLGEIVGTKITPLLAKGANALVGLIDKAGELGGPFRKASGAVANAARDIIAWVHRFQARNREDIQSVVTAVRNLGRFFKNVFEDIIVPAVRAVLPHIKRALEGIVTVLRGVVRVVTGIINGDWSKAWDGVKDIVRGALKAAVASLRGSYALFASVIKTLGRKIISGLVSALSGLAGAIKDAVVDGVKKGVNAAKGAVNDIIGKINPFGDGIGRAAKSIAGDGLGFMGGSAGGSGAGLMGADMDLGPFARIGAGMGLHVSSGLFGRENSITSSGNKSYHSSGDAIDMSGPPSAMGRFFRTMKSTFGSRLRELIYTPGGAGIKDGRPFQYTGQVAQDHYDHVHVAYTGPFGDGIGKGLGRFNSTSYGPPWGGINGGGITATGVNLKSAPHRYGVAVDPKVIPLGTRLKIKPNPFGYNGYFTAFDTGGAIKGNRIDFYDWRGRSAQMNWGTKPVTVWTEDENPLGGGSGARGKSRPMSAAEAFRQTQETARMRSGVALRAAGRGRKRARTGPGKGVDRGEGLADGDPGLLGAPEVADNTSATDALTAAIEANTRATEEHKAALDNVGAEMKRQTDLAESTIATDGWQKSKWIADVLSGQFGRGIVGRGMTAGTGVEVAYAMSIWQIA